MLYRMKKDTVRPGRPGAGDGAMARQHLTRATTMDTEMDVKSWPERTDTDIAKLG